MAIDLTSQIPQSNNPSLDTIEQLKVQAKIQMDCTTGEVNRSSQSLALDSTTIHPADHTSNSVNIANDSYQSPVLNEVPDQDKAVTNTSLCCSLMFHWILLQHASDTPALPRSLPPPHIAKNTPCRLFAIGSCTYGNACTFSHEPFSVVNLPATSNGPIDTLTYPDLSTFGFFCPHPAQSYKEAALQRYYGYCDSGPWPPNNQPVFNAPIPPPNSLASANTTTGLPATESQGYHSQSTPLPADHDNYHPSGLPSFGMPYGFSPENPPPMDYAPGTPVDAHPNSYYPFPGSIPPQGVYGPMRPHGPSAYYKVPPMGDVSFNGYPITHLDPVGPKNSSGSVSLPVSHSAQDPVYYPQQTPFPLPPSHDGSQCHPMGEYLSHYQIRQSPPLRPMDGYSPSTGHYPSHPAPNSTKSTYIAGSGPPAVLNDPGRSTEPTRLGPLPCFQRNNSNFRRGHAGRGGGGRTFCPSLSPNNNGINPGPHQSQPHGPIPHSAKLRSSSSTSGPIQGPTSLPVTPLDKRGPRGPCSFFAENQYGLLGSEVGFGAKMICKTEGFNSRAIPRYALWEKRYKLGPASGKEKREGDEQPGSNEEVGMAVNESKLSSSDLIRQKFDNIGQQKREGNSPGHQFPLSKNYRGLSEPSQPSHLKFVTASAYCPQQVPNGEDFPALSRSKTLTSTTHEKPVGPDGKVERNDDEPSSKSGAGGSEVSNLTNATSTKNSPGLKVRKVPVIGGASFALAAARGACMNTKPPLSQKPKLVPAKVVDAISTASVEEGIKSLEINTSAQEVSALA
ncbi:hypothetical protein DFH28DRAFT_1086605 [Melampsora americana]|nr:hypothetical protein DFH28DRAFT_1086605 [Melampsora americana]